MDGNELRFRILVLTLLSHSASRSASLGAFLHPPPPSSYPAFRPKLSSFPVQLSTTRTAPPTLFPYTTHSFVDTSTRPNGLSSNCRACLPARARALSLSLSLSPRVSHLSARTFVKWQTLHWSSRKRPEPWRTS